MNAVVEDSNPTPKEDLRDHLARLVALKSERASLDAQAATAYAAIEAARAPTPEIDALLAEKKAAAGAIFLKQSPGRPLADIQRDLDAAQAAQKVVTDKAEAASGANDLIQAQIQDQQARYLAELAMGPLLAKAALFDSLKPAIAAYREASKAFTDAFLELTAITEAGASLNIGFPLDYRPIAVGKLANAVGTSLPIEMPAFGAMTASLQSAIAQRAAQKIAEMQGGG